MEPEYSEEALKAKFQATVVVFVEIDSTGHVVNPRVLRPVGLGLDEKAIEAAKKWQFTPALKDGQPVPFSMQIEFNFRLGKR